MRDIRNDLKSIRLINSTENLRKISFDYRRQGDIGLVYGGEEGFASLSLLNPNQTIEIHLGLTNSLQRF